MLDDATRTMIVLDLGASRFQLRAGAMIWSRGHILIHRGVTDPFWSLPGGRVEFHESGAETLVREIDEEIGCRAIIGPLRFVIENFFELSGRNAHEVGLYYEAELTDPPAFHESEVVHRSRDGATDLEFRWLLPTQAALDDVDLKPLPLRRLIETMPAGVTHLVHRDSA